MQTSTSQRHDTPQRSGLRRFKSIVVEAQYQSSGWTPGVMRGGGAGSSRRYRCGFGGSICILAVAFGHIKAAYAEELIQPPVCSSLESEMPAELKSICVVTSLKENRKKVKVDLTAQTSEIIVGGYRVITENYNGAYLSPVVAAKAGDTVAARLVNVLAPRETIGLSVAPPPEASRAAHASDPPRAPAPTQARPSPRAAGPEAAAHEHEDGNPTNLHYFHGGIVTPRNKRLNDDDTDAGKGEVGKGKGDNVYVTLKNGFDGEGRPQTVEYDVPIPGEKINGDKELHAGVLEKEGWISHPDGLNWYHSHMHGRSTDQVMGGMSGLLSVGEDKANVRAKCATDPPSEECNRHTSELKRSTIVRYALLRDIPLREISASPEDAAPYKTARWAPEDRDFRGQCLPDAKHRKGFCQREDDDRSAWLFTLNGQRFPTITVEGGQNLLLRIGNLSANVTYWLELQNESEGQTRPPPPLTVLSLDGVVPAKPGDAGNIDAFVVQDLLLMPASRAEIYVRNDGADADTRVYILRTKRLDTGNDIWPEIQLARVVLKPSRDVSRIVLARNAPALQFFPAVTFFEKRTEADKPTGCVRDLEKGEHRRVTFFPQGTTSRGTPTEWSISTEIMKPKDGSGNETDFESVEDARLGKFAKDELGKDIATSGIPFEDYVLPDGTIDWLGLNQKHVCIRLDPGVQSPSRQQLWVLVNNSGTLHNFHIHQMKFRLATRSELATEYRIVLGKTVPSSTCPDKNCGKPDYQLFEENPPPETKSYPVWHDTIAVPDRSRVYIIMSFTAAEQIGRYVFHCHILKHEDTGLMAPIEVWARFRGEFDRR